MKIKTDLQNTGFFRYKRLNGEYLLTNDSGDYHSLATTHFDSFLSNQHKDLPLNVTNRLKSLGFIKGQDNLEGLASRFQARNSFLGQGTSLHIVVLTLRCDHKCVYCQASAKGLKDKLPDMDINTARNVVDRIFESPSKNISIEFQGGEPLINIQTLKFIVDYARTKNKQAKKHLDISLVTNFTFMNNQIMDYLLKNNIGICTSLDGPEKLHNKNRVSSLSGGAYQNTVKWIRRIRKEYKKGKLPDRLSALPTITRFSLGFYREIIDEYVELGFLGIPLRGLSPFGQSKKNWKNIGYTAEEFIAFLKQAMDYIIEINFKGKLFKEIYMRVFLSKILLGRDPAFMDLRSPCGAGIGQLAYHVDGDVYCCDEGRMLASMGDDNFKLGNVMVNSYHDFMINSTTRAMCVASCLNNLPGCHECVYIPYCGVCPLYNYFTEGNIFSQYKNNRLCQINSAILDYIFIKLRDSKAKEVFERWIGKSA